MLMYSTSLKLLLIDYHYSQQKNLNLLEYLDDQGNQPHQMGPVQDKSFKQNLYI